MNPDVMRRTTCGELYRRFHALLDAAEWMRPDALPHGDVRTADRAVGFMQGQAEKVASGACRACMVRPAPDWRAWAERALMAVCRHYDLGLRTLFHADMELWAFDRSPATQALIVHLHALRQHSPESHALRALLCGIPVDRVDVCYHERAGHGRRCEPDASVLESREGGR